MPGWASFDPMALRVEFVGHACVRIEIDGVAALTDPVLRDRIAHIRRIAPSPSRAAIESVDVVLISHAHHDHLDVPSLRGLPGSPAVICAPPAAGPVRRAGLAPVPLDAGGSAEVGSVRIEATDAEHDGRRWGVLGRGESVGFTLRGPSGSVHFAGDTGIFEGMRRIARVDVALIPVAGWGPKLGAGHIGPRQAAEAVAMFEPRVAVPIHWGTYRRMLMRRRGPDDAPAREFLAELAELAPNVRGMLLQPGEGAEVGTSRGPD